MNFDARGSDAVHAIYDFGARHILQDIKETADKTARARGRKIHIVAESDLNDVRLLLPPAQGGYGIDAQWSDDFHHMAHVALTGERQGYYEDYVEMEQFPKLMEHTFVLDGCYSPRRGRSHGGADAGLPGDRFCIQNHDQIGNRACGERLNALVSPAAQRLAASLLLLAPYLPLLFMGEEYGEEHPFQFFYSFSDSALIENVRRGRRREFESFHAHGGKVPDPQDEATFAASRLTWSWEADPRKAGLRCLYQDLLRFRRECPALRDYSQRSARMIPDAQSGAILELVRGGRRPDAGGIIQAFFNLTAQPQSLPFQDLPAPLWRSEAPHYDGERRAGMPHDLLLPYECLVFGSTQ